MTGGRTRPRTQGPVRALTRPLTRALGRPIQRPTSVLAVLFFAAALGFFLRTLYGYGWEYDTHPWNPASSEGREPGFYYIDWSDDFADPADLAEATTNGVLRTVRAQRKDPAPARPDDANGNMDEWAYDPVGVVQGGLALSDQVLANLEKGTEPTDAPTPTNDVATRRKALIDQAEWLHDSATILPDSSAVWTVPWTAHTYGLEPPWISAIVQGQAASLLTRTARLGRPQDLTLARAAVRPLLTPRWSLQSGQPGHRFFEEYPSSPPNSVLNGGLFAWLGLWDICRATNDPELRDIALQRLDEIESQIPIFETSGGWTRYDRARKRRASPSYQELHASLAFAIAAETGRSFWEEKAKTWNGAVRSPRQKVTTFVQVAWNKLIGDEAEVTPIPFFEGKKTGAKAAP